MDKRRVVITGIGVLSPIGKDREAFWQGLMNGESGVDSISRFDTSNFEVRIAAEVKNFDVEKYIDRKEARRMDLFAQYAMASGQQAIEDSGILLDKVNRERFGVISASGIGGLDTFEKEFTALFEKGPNRVSPFFITKMISDIAPGLLSMRYGLKGPNYSTTSACASSSHALGESLRHIQQGDADLMLAGGSEAAITRMGIAGFMVMKAMSTRNDDPKTASRPFEKNRDGFVIGEGSALVVLEELEHAKARGAKIYAELIGAGYSADAYHITAPDPEGDGAARAMKLALKDAKISPSEVDYINAHGTSTPHNDKTETVAIKRLFGDRAYDIPISSTKSMTGHLLGAGGALELVAVSLMLQRGKIHPTINYNEPDPECDLFYVPNKAIDKPINIAISNSFGFGGHNVCLVLKKY